MITILRDRGLGELLASDSIETLASGFQFTEGPLWLPAQDALLFQDLKAERTYRVELGGDHAVSVVREATRAANGQTFGPDGDVLFCEQNGRAVSRMSPDGSHVQEVVSSWSGRRLNSPNDIISRSDGQVFFTDPPYGVSPADRALHFQGVYRLDRAGSLHLLLDDFEKPNGLALSPDERILYVCDTARYHLRAFELDANGDVVLGSGRVLARLDPGRPGGPDGIKVDRAGRLYIAVALGVWVFDAEGSLLGILAMDQRPSNLAWCGAEANVLAITAVDAVHRVQLHAQGIAPPFQPAPSW